ncbi:hypothetical protein E2C01_068867 [Portunus trituberculatus]|uniref:Uncharacterized protein n=1 Tax=Portunus trituberculatus TaxID=210409 RepID=A0A5B7HXP1_PORTR|nr:hypothetical protein [Portunus trituberculatus]
MPCDYCQSVPALADRDGSGCCAARCRSERRHFVLLRHAEPRVARAGGHRLGVAQIVITAATPVVEAREARADEDSRAEADQDEDAHHPEAERSEVEGEALILDDEGRPPPPPPAPEGPMEMRMEACGAEGGIRDLGGSEERSPSPKSPSPSDGPPDLDPEKLKTLERIKESIA